MINVFGYLGCLHPEGWRERKQNLQPTELRPDVHVKAF